jgi:twitching motility protein PilT
MDAFSIVGRKLIDKAPTFEELDTNPTIRDLANLPSGIVLVSGVTGSGKSTLMAAMIDQINTYKGA